MVIKLAASESLGRGVFKKYLFKALFRPIKSKPLHVGPGNLYFNLTRCPNQLGTAHLLGKSCLMSTPPWKSALTGGHWGSEHRGATGPTAWLCSKNSGPKSPAYKPGEVLNFLLRTRPRAAE